MTVHEQAAALFERTHPRDRALWREAYLWHRRDRPEASVYNAALFAVVCVAAKLDGFSGFQFGNAYAHRRRRLGNEASIPHR